MNTSSKRNNFKAFKQLDAKDCGPTCLRMVANYYGKSISLNTLRQKTGLGREGVNLFGICQAAENIGLRTKASKTSIDKLISERPLPCILHWKQNHFVVLYKIKRKIFYIADPETGKYPLTQSEFEKAWCIFSTPETKVGVSLFLDPTTSFYQNQDEPSADNFTIASLYKYLLTHKKLIIQLVFSLILISIFQLLLPLLTAQVVDQGIKLHNIQLITLILTGQVLIYISQSLVTHLRNWTLIHISTRLNLNILSEFIAKIISLPVTFFESRLTGDILRRIDDHKRIETLLTGTSINTLFSAFNILLLSTVLLFYNQTIFIIFLVSTIVYISWLLLFLKKRRKLDFRNFTLQSKSHNQAIELIKGMSEIKLSGSEIKKRWEWEETQFGLFRLEYSSLRLNLLQDVGTFLISQSKNLSIVLISAIAVMNDQITIGAMLAIQVIVGELNSPVQQLVTLVQQLQDAKIAIERMNDLYSLPSESLNTGKTIDPMSVQKDIYVNNISFSYPGAGNKPVISNLTFKIPAGKTTAIVGASGSGKSTILKLLINFYEPTTGDIKLGDVALNKLEKQNWRKKCGAVLHDGFIFSDTVAGNIAIGEEDPNVDRLSISINIANLQDLIDALPFGLNTKIGDEGIGISQGQKQRILIARAVYKNPNFIFFDEATNALDANNETTISQNLQEFFRGKTVVIVAHRLSTVKNADNIIVLKNGTITEQGTHLQLLSRKSAYYELVHKQLEKNHELIQYSK